MAAGSSEQTGGRAERALGVLRWVATPLVLALGGLALFVYLSGQRLDSIERRSLNADFILDRLIEHIELTAVSTALVIAIAVPLGILLTRRFARRITPAAVGVANLGQAIPSIGVIVLLAIVLGLGFKYAVAALVIYTVLPVLRNTMVGLQQVDRSLIEAGRGMGMSKAAVLMRVEMPLAVPVMMAGIRTALIINVGTATLATFAGAGGLGDIIDQGIALGRDPVLITGAVLTAILALMIDWMAGVAESIARPKGLA